MRTPTVRTRERDGAWSWVFEVYSNGKRRQVTGTVAERGKPDTPAGRRAEKAALAAGHAALAKHNDGRGVDRDRAKLTVKACVEEVLALLADELSVNTLRGYEWIAERRITPHIGGVKLAQLDTGHVEQWKQTLLRSGGVDGKALSPQSVRLALRLLHRVLGEAVRLGWIARNPAAGVKAPKPARKRELHTWTAEQARTFDAATIDDEFGIAYHLALTTGLRRGEILGLQHRDIDLDRGVLSVRRARVAVGYEVVEGDTKTGHARTISLGPSTVARLRAHRKVQRETHLALGMARAEYVVTRSDGTLPHPQTLTYAFDEAVAKSGLPRIRFHDQRHTHATLLLENGVHPKVVQERLGHSSISITLDVYSHVTASMQSAAASAIDDAIFGNG